MSGFSKLALGGAFLLAGCAASAAGTLVHTPVNPLFGGSPLNGGGLSAMASAQNHGAHKTASGSGALSTGQMFANQLTSQLYASLANKITQAMFGGDGVAAQTSGSYAFGGTTVSFVRAGAEIQITINDGTTVTKLSVPTSG